MKVVINHSLPQNNAIECSKKIIDNLKEEHNDRISDVFEKWDKNKSDFSFKLMSFNISGNIKVTENEVIIEGKLPFAASMFKGIIEKTIKDNANKMLNNCN